MAITLFEMARRYVEKIPPAVSGAGGHNQTFTVACSLVKGFDLTVDEARPILHEFNARCSPPWSDAELEHKLRQADKVVDERERGWLRLADTEPVQVMARCDSAPLPRQPPAKATFEEGKLKAFAQRWREFVDTAWLADRSPVCPWRLDADAYLRAVFRDGEKVVVFTNQRSQGQAIWPLQPVPTQGPEGVWYLSQPVDGREYPNPRTLGPDGAPKLSRRSEESVVDWRHLVLESDEADARDWMGALVQLPLRIVAIYTSGGRSIHALVRVDAPTKQEWDSCVQQVRPILVTLGADPKAMSAVRLTRLPGCLRGGKLQKLLYLAPEPTNAPICAMPRLRDVLHDWLIWAPAAMAYRAAEVREQQGQMLANCREVLEWYESSAIARSMLRRVKAWSASADSYGATSPQTTDSYGATSPQTTDSYGATSPQGADPSSPKATTRQGEVA